MGKQFYPNKYQVGDIVCANVHPELKLVIRRYIDQVYYCKVFGQPEQKELVYYERELTKIS